MSVNTPYTTHRRILPLSEAPSRVEIEGHKCEFNPDKAHDKAQRRMYDIFNRFAFTYYLKIQTNRAPTKLQTGQSKCGNCASAHTSSAPTTYDNMMPRILAEVKDNLSPIKLTLVANRIGLKTPEKENLAALSPQSRNCYISSKISPETMRSSFAHTAYEKQMSNTIEGPIASNKLDLKLERKLWKLEERLGSQVLEGTYTPEVATQITFQHLERMLKVAIQNLKLRIEQIDNYCKAEKLLDEIETPLALKSTLTLDEAMHYADAVQFILSAHDALFTPMEFSSIIKDDQFRNLKHRKDIIWIKNYVATVEEITEDEEFIDATLEQMKRIKKDPISEEKSLFATKIKTDIRLQVQEAEAQLEGMQDLGFSNIQKFSQLLFGILEKGSRRPPTTEELVEQLLNMTKKENVSVNTDQK